jgi:L-2-hydroxyglutarate oxidase LhgO
MAAVETVDVLVIGAGVIGLAIAEELARSKKTVIVVERHDGFGRETSSRNSEVIHCGMYYAEDLLKTRLCVEGNPLLYELCEQHGIPCRKTGKIVVATNEEEAGSLSAILEQGTTNGVRGLTLISPGAIRELEPNVRGVLGLHSTESGIIDSHRLMDFFEREARSHGATIAYNCTVMSASKGARGYEVGIRDADGERLDLRAERVINSAGLHADRIAEMTGIDCEAAGYRIRPCKGEYFKVADRHRGKLRRLIYPVPSKVHLGAHAVLGLDGGLKIGPSSFYVESIEYGVDPTHQAEFHAKAVRFLPFLDADDLTPDMAGIRPKLYMRGEPFRDFVIREESDRGLPGFINLIGMESPGLTSCLAIADMVGGLVP